MAVMESPCSYGEERIFDVFARCKSFDEILRTVQKHLSLLGIENPKFYRFRTICPAESTNVVGVYPESLVAAIEKNEFYSSDLALKHLMSDGERHVKPFFRSKIDNHVRAADYYLRPYEKHMEFVDFLEKCKINDMLFIPAGEDAGKNSAFCCWSQGGDAERFRAIATEHMTELCALASALEKVIWAKYRTLTRLGSNTITPAVRGALQLLVDKDLSSGEVATLLGLHEVTMYKHMAAAKKAVKANTLVGLVVGAWRSGQIELE